MEFITTDTAPPGRQDLKVGGEKRSLLLSYALSFASLFIDRDENHQAIKLDILDALDLIRPGEWKL